MKSSVSLLSFVLCAASAWSQGTSQSATPVTPASPATSQATPATSQATPAASPAADASAQLKPRGPEAIAQQDPKRVVATIDGKQITAEQAVNLLKIVPPDQKRAVPSLQTLVEKVYMIQQFADQAAKLNLDQQEPWKDQIQFNRENILAQAYIERLTKGGGASTDEAKRYYDAHPDEFDQAKVSGIFVSFSPPGTPASSANGASKTEDQARQKADDLEKKIKAGSDFAALARTDSDNQQLAARGGDLGTLTRESPNVPPDVKSAIFKLQPGQVSEPIRVQAGFYIFKMDSRAKQPFDQARGNILLKQEFDKYKLQVQDPDFFSAANRPAPNIPSLQKPAAPSSQPQSKPPGQ